MADKCANCGATISLEPDANGGMRWVSGEGADESTTCADKDGVKVRPFASHTPKVKADKAADEADESAEDKGGK